MTSKQNNSSMSSNDDSLEFETVDVLLTMESLEYFSFFGVMAHHCLHLVSFCEYFQGG